MATGFVVVPCRQPSVRDEAGDDKGEDMNANKGWEKWARGICIVIAGAGAARLIYLIALAYLGELPFEEFDYRMGQLLWLLYVSVTGLVFWVFTKADDEVFEPFNHLPLSLSRMQIVILITALWPIWSPVAIVMYLRGD